MKVATGQKRTSKATQAKQKHGRQLTDLILKVLEKQKDGVNIYDLTVLFKHEVKSPGTIKSAIERLKKENAIEQREFKQDGRKVIQYFLKRQQPAGYIEVNKDLLNPKSWKQNAFAYTVDTEKILVTPKEEPTYKERKFYPVPLQQDENKLKFILPDELIDFYQLRDKGTDLQVEGERILILVESKSRVIAKPSRLLRILLVDDIPGDQIIKRITKKLKGYSHNVEIVSSTSEFESIANKKRFDFLILDMGMELVEVKRYDKIITRFKKFNPNSHAIIITAHAYGKPQIEKYTNKGFSWVYDKDVPQLEEKIHTRMIREFQK